MMQETRVEVATGSGVGRGGDWVSKTDLSRYYRCPYSYSLLSRGEISPEDMVDGFTVLLMQEGSAFHESVVAAEVAAGAELLPAQVFENRKLQLYGVPDGIRNDAGAEALGLSAMVPIEIKWHGQVQTLDELELAFYWLLLEPHRTADGPPHGLLILHREGAQVEVEISISARRLEQVTQLIDDIRRARRESVAPRMCGCHVCSVVRRDEVRRMTAAKQDVSLVLGIGPSRAARLNAIGVRSYGQLLDLDPDEVARAMRREGDRSVGASEVSRWQHHARSYVAGAAVVFGERLPIGDSYFILDLEYLTPPWGEHIYLAGVLLVQPFCLPQLTQIWAADPLEGERNLLIQIAQYIDAHRQLPVVTWAGQCADIPWLRKSASRHGLPLLGGLDDGWGRHFDLYLWSQRSVRFPTPYPGLKDMAQYFGIPYASDIHGGTEAQLLYLESTKTRNRARREHLKNRLLSYNRDDLEALVEVVERIRSVCSN